MSVEEIKVGTLVARMNVILQKWNIGIIVDIQNKYPIMMPETCNYSVKWFNAGTISEGLSYGYVYSLVKSYEENALTDENCIDFKG